MYIDKGVLKNIAREPSRQSYIAIGIVKLIDDLENSGCKDLRVYRSMSEKLLAFAGVRDGEKVEVFLVARQVCINRQLGTTLSLLEKVRT